MKNTATKLATGTAAVALALTMGAGPAAAAGDNNPGWLGPGSLVCKWFPSTCR